MKHTQLFGGSAVLFLSGIIVVGCAVVPAGPVVYAPPPTEGIPPAQFVVGGGPLYYEAVLPGVAFYPLYIQSRLCVRPLRYHRGAWVDVDGRTRHHGHLVYRHPTRDALGKWHHHGGVSAGGHKPQKNPLTQKKPSASHK